MNPIGFVKNCFYIDQFFTVKNIKVLTGLVAEISLIALLVLAEVPLSVIVTTLCITNLLKIVIVAKKLEKKDLDASSLCKKLQERERDIVNLNEQFEELKKKFTN